MRDKDFSASVRIRLKFGLDVNVDLTEHHLAVLDHIVGRAASNFNCYPPGTTKWKPTDLRNATRFLSTMYEDPILHDELVKAQNKIRGLSDVTSELSIVHDVTHIDPVEFIVMNGEGKLWSVGRNGFS